MRQGTPLAACPIQVQNGIDHFSDVGGSWVSTWRGAWGRMPGGAQARLGMLRRPSSSAIFNTGRSSVGSRVVRAAWTSCWKFFLKRVLRFLVGLGMTRTWSQLVPAMSMQEAVDIVAMHFMLHFRAHSPAESARPWQSLPVRLARKRAGERPVLARGSDIRDGVRLWPTAR